MPCLNLHHQDDTNLSVPSFVFIFLFFGYARFCVFEESLGDPVGFCRQILCSIHNSETIL